MKLNNVAKVKVSGTAEDIDSSVSIVTMLQA